MRTIVRIMEAEGKHTVLALIDGKTIELGPFNSVKEAAVALSEYELKKPKAPKKGKEQCEK